MIGFRVTIEKLATGPDADAESGCKVQYTKPIRIDDFDDDTGLYSADAAVGEAIALALSMFESELRSALATLAEAITHITTRHGEGQFEDPIYNDSPLLQSAAENLECHSFTLVSELAKRDDAKRRRQSMGDGEGKTDGP